MMKDKITIKGMHCDSCVILIEDELIDADGVMKAKVDLDSGVADIEYDESVITRERIIDIIKDTGFDAE